LADVVVHLPVKCPTSATFGGKRSRELFITTHGPDGGGLYQVKDAVLAQGAPQEFKVVVAE
jgi:sugar lactone lactonase YvrE